MKKTFSILISTFCVFFAINAQIQTRTYYNHDIVAPDGTHHGIGIQGPIRVTFDGTTATSITFGYSTYRLIWNGSDADLGSSYYRENDNYPFNYYISWDLSTMVSELIYDSDGLEGGTKGYFYTYPPNSGGGYSGGYGSGGYSGGQVGGNSPKSSTYTTCGYCRGTGNCSSCKGEGKYYNYSASKWFTCGSCNGSGRCFNCFGKGKY